MIIHGIFFFILEVIINSFSSTLRLDWIISKPKELFPILNFSFNQVDLQNMMDRKEIKKKSHQSKFVKSFCYYTIVFSLQMGSVSSHYFVLFSPQLMVFSLTLFLTIEEEKVNMKDSQTGDSHLIDSSKVRIIMGIGWAAFVLSIFFNIVYYALHPSQVRSLKFNR